MIRERTVLTLAVSFSIVLLLASAGLNNASADALTSINLDMPVEKSFPVTQGETITFTGQLIRASTLVGVSNATVNIVQQVAFGQSTLLASGKTAVNGFYSIPWVVDIKLVAGISGGSFGTESTQGRENRFQVVVVARFDGNDQYLHSVSNAQSFEVRLNALAIRVEKSSYLANENVAAKIMVKDINGQLVDPDKITSRFDNTLVTLVKQSIGVYAFSAAALSLGNHQLQVFVEREGHTADDELITFEALKRRTSLSISTDKSSYKLGETVSISASLIDKSSNELVTDKFVNVFLTSPNFFVRQLAIVDGKASYKLAENDLAGTWTIYASFAGDRSYFASGAHGTFTASKEVEERISLSRPTLVDRTGQMLKDVTVGQQVMIQTKVTSNFETTEDITYISKVKDTEGITVALSLITSTLTSGQALELAVSWIPEAAGEYIAEAFVWKSIKDPESLSEPKRSMINVTA